MTAASQSIYHLWTQQHLLCPLSRESPALYAFKSQQGKAKQTGICHWLSPGFPILPGPFHCNPALTVSLHLVLLLIFQFLQEPLSTTNPYRAWLLSLLPSIFSPLPTIPSGSSHHPFIPPSFIRSSNTSYLRDSSKSDAGNTARGTRLLFRSLHPRHKRQKQWEKQKHVRL